MSIKKFLSVFISIILIFSITSTHIYALDLSIDMSEENIMPVAATVVDEDGNIHPSDGNIPVNATAIDNGDGSYMLGVTFDNMDGVNSFAGWYNGETLLSTEESYTTPVGLAIKDISARIICKSVITGGLGFESYTSSTSLRVDPKQSGTPPYDDKWGMWSLYTRDSSIPVGYENYDWDFDITTAYGDTTVNYCTAYDIDTAEYSIGETTVKPYSGNSMFYFATRHRSIVRKLDNLKPDTEYEVSFYTYSLSKWDFLYQATIADTYDMPTGTIASTDTVKVYNSYSEMFGDSSSGITEIKDTKKVQKWSKITLKFVTDADDTEVYLHLRCMNGNNASKTSKQFIDNLTVTEVPQPETFSECVKFLGNSIRREIDDVPQALRFKFEINKNIFNVYKDSGYELKEYGAIVTKSDYLGIEDDLVINDTMTVGGKKIFKGTAYNKDNGTNVYLNTTDDGVVVSFAMYNIGAFNDTVNYNDYNINYAVRPYAIYEDAEGNEYIYYDGLEECALFDVVDAVLTKDTSDDIADTFGNTSYSYASHLADICAVRNLLANDEVNTAYVSANRDAYTTNGSATCLITPTDLGENIALHTELQASYLAGEYSNITAYADGKSELSRPVPIDFSFTISAEGNGSLLGYLLTLSENSDLSNGKMYALQSTSTSIWNLKIGTDYYWNVTAIYTDGIYVSGIDKFSTETTAPRNLYIGGVTNARDLGGWTINSNQTNQGLVFRSGQLDITTANGQITLFEDLNIKTEIDIRKKGEASSAFGDKINYYSLYMVDKGDILASNTESIVKFFEVLGDENNYPVLYHCRIGTDRTGMMSFLLNGLLGASEEQLYIDYLYSNFANIGSARTQTPITNYINAVKACDGDTLAENIYNYLLGIGVDVEDMDTYIRMMTN